MNKLELDDIRRRLETEREELLARLAGQPEVRASGNWNTSPDDMAVDTYDQQRRAALRSRSEQILEQVEAALQRMDAGKYGVCESCGGLINPERLEVLPYATLCIRCSASQSV